MSGSEENRVSSKVEYFDNLPIQIKQRGGFFIAYSATSGGPICTGKTKEEAVKKYKEMHVVHRVVTQFLLAKNNQLN